MTTHKSTVFPRAATEGEPSGERFLGTVVLLTNFIPPYRLPLLEAIADRVPRFTVLTSTPVEENRSWRPNTGRLDVRMHRTLTLRRSWRHPSGFSDPIFVHVPWDTLPLLRSLRPDIVISSELGFRSLFSALYCRVTRRTKLVLWLNLSERTEQGRGRVRHGLRRWLLGQASRVVVNGASGARYVRRFGVAPGRIDYVWNTILPAFNDLGWQHPSQPKPLQRLLFVGQLIERKGLVPFILALDAWARANPSRTITLTVVGSGPLRPQIEAFLPGGGLEIRLLGERDPAELPALFADADAFAFPTLADEWGLVVNEALACGVPVIGSIHSQAVEELCAEGITGWVFDPEDENSMAAVIERSFSASATEVAEMSEHARARGRAIGELQGSDAFLASIRAAAERPCREG